MFYTNPARRGNDTVIRMVRHYWASSGQPQRKTIIARENELHTVHHRRRFAGRHDLYARAGDLPIPGIAHIEQCTGTLAGGDLSRKNTA